MNDFSISYGLIQIVINPHVFLTQRDISQISSTSFSHFVLKNNSLKCYIPWALLISVKVDSNAADQLLVYHFTGRSFSTKQLIGSASDPTLLKFPFSVYFFQEYSFQKFLQHLNRSYQTWTILSQIENTNSNQIDSLGSRQDVL